MPRIRYPGPFGDGDGWISGKTLNEVCKTGQRCVPIAGDGLLERTLPDGTELRIDWSRVSASVAYPWRITVTNLGCYVQYAQVGDIVPTIATVPMSTTLTTNFITTTNDGNVVLALEVDDSEYDYGIVDSASLIWHEGSAGAKPSDDATTKHYIIGRIADGIAANAYTNSVNWFRAGGPGSPYILFAV